MNKNTVIGLLIIAVILFVFSWYNQRQYEEARKEQIRKDSVEMASRPAFPIEPKQSEPNVNDSTSQILAAPQEVSMLAQARKGTEEFFTLENDEITVTLSTKGGRIAAVNLKDYTTYDGRPLMLFETSTNSLDNGQTPGSSFNFTCFAPERINTADYYFEPIKSDGTMTFRLHADSASYIDFIYSMNPDEEYMVDFRIELSNIKRLLVPNQSDMTLNWNIISPQQEKGFQNENNFTTIAYRFPGESSIEDIGKSEGEKKEKISTKVNWIGFKQQFFTSILVNKENFSQASLDFRTFPAEHNNIKNFNADLTMPYSTSVDGYDFNFFFGPNKFLILNRHREMAFQRLVPLGWGIFGWINRFLVIPVFDFLGGFIANFGIVILLLTIFIKILIAPLTYKSYLSTARMRLLKPEMDKINEKFPKKEDALKKQQASMALYKKAGVNPMGGCIPMLIQMPILIAMFQFFPASIELRGQSFLWADDLSSYDSILQLPFKIPFYGEHVSLFALLMAISLYLSSKINMAQNPMNNQQMPGMKFMMLYLMPIMLLLWFNNYASGLTYYFLLSNLITIGQTYAFRYAVDDEKLHAKMKANATKPVKKSKWQQRLEDMQKMQQQQQKQTVASRASRPSQQAKQNKKK